MKKSLIFWFAAITCAALFLVGCESPTNGESGAAGSPGPATLPANATPELLAAYFASTDKVFLVADLDEGTFTVPAGKTLAVVGTVDISSVGTVINAFDGTLDVSAGGFTADGDNVFIVAEAKVAEVKAAASGGIVPAYVASIPATPSAITEDTVLSGLTIGGSGTSATDFVAFAGSANTVYVAGDVTIDATTTPFNTGSAKITVLGETTAKGTLTVGATADLGKLTASGALTLTNVSNVGKLDTSTYTVTSSDLTVDLDSLDSGAGGKLVLTGAVTAVTIGGGTGNVEFPNATGTLTALSLENTGTIAFNHTAAALSIPGTVQAVFDGNVTLAGGISTPASDTSKITFNGNVTLADTKAITIGETTASAVTLKAGKSIYAGANKLVTAVTDTEFTADVDGATLTAAVSAKTLTVGDQSLTITSGTLAVAAGATLVANTDVTVGSGSLVLNGETGTDGAKLTGTGKVAFGYASISGSTHGWQAVGADTSIAFSGATTAVAITGTGTSPKLVAAGATVGAITIGTTDGATLSLTNAEINVAAGGSILIKDPSSGSNILKLAGATAIIGGLTGGSVNQTLASNSITNAEVDTDSTDGVQVVAGAASGAGNVSLSGKGDGSKSTIKVQDSESSNATIDKSTKIGADA